MALEIQVNKKFIQLSNVSTVEIFEKERNSDKDYVKIDEPFKRKNWFQENCDFIGYVMPHEVKFYKDGRKRKKWNAWSSVDESYLEKSYMEPSGKSFSPRNGMIVTLYNWYNKPNIVFRMNSGKRHVKWFETAEELRSWWENNLPLAFRERPNIVKIN